MQTENRFVHYAGEKENLVNLLILGYPPQLVMEGNRYLGFEEFPFLLGGWHTPSVAKLISLVKF